MNKRAFVSQLIFFTLVISYTILYSLLYFVPEMTHLHRAFLMLGFFYLVLFWFLNNFSERTPLVKWTTSAVLFTLFAQFIIELVGLHDFVHDTPILNFIVHFLFGIAYFIFALSVFKESFMQATDRHIRKASFDYNDAVLFDYDKRKKAIDIQFSQSFCEKYKLEQSLLSISEAEFRRYVNQADLAKSDWFDERLPHDAIINQKYHLNFPNISKMVSLQVKGSYQIISRIVVLAFDVSALEDAEADLLSSNSRRIELLENLPLGIIEQTPIFDENGVFVDYEYVYCNKAFGRMTGYPPEVVVGNKASVIIPNQYKERIAKFGQAILEGKSVSFDTTIQPINHTFSVNVYPTANKTFISIYQDVHQLKVLNEQLHYLATHDKMTNLYNQRGLYEILEERTDIKSAVCFYVSIGNYERIYDFYGYKFIEGILKQLSDVFIPYIRAGHLVATTNSSDLIVLLINPTDKEINQALEAARSSVYRKMTIEHTQVLVKQNIGYAVLGEHADNIHQLIACASLAMSEAASSEHNIIVKYVPKLKETLEHNIAMANKLDEALENGLIRIAFQQIVDSRTGEVVLLEALARWTDDEMGYIAPDVIFDFAKKSNMIDLLDDYLLENTLKEYAKLKHKGVTGRLSLNVSAPAFLRPTFRRLVNEKAKEYQLTPNNIVIEVSETTFVRNIEQTITMIKNYKIDGFLIAIDDFGSQYSSIGILDLIPYDYLKLDGIFASRLGSESIKELIRVLVSITERDNGQIIAEKIENEAMVSLMQNLGCHIHQGYHYHRPEIFE